RWPKPDLRSWERAVEAIVRTWIDALGEELWRVYDPARAQALLRRYRHAFSQGYRENYSALDTVGDIRLMEGLSPNRPLGVDFHRRAGDRDTAIGFKTLSSERSTPRSQRGPV